MTYADGSRVRDARVQYFAANGFSDATYEDAWVKFKVGPFPIAFPNTASRKRAIPLHDLHHVATGYGTNLVGEGEIAAWEIGGSCTTYWAAWVLNGMALWYGLVLWPRRVYRAFVRGRHSRTLYRVGWSAQLLDITVGELRHRLALDTAVEASWRDRLAFAAWAIALWTPAIAAVAIAWRLIARSAAG